MANQDSDRPPAPGKLPVLRKIPGGPKTLPPIAPPPRRSLPSLTDIGPIGAGVGHPPVGRLPPIRTPLPGLAALAAPVALADESVHEPAPRASAATPLPVGPSSVSGAPGAANAARGSVPPVVVSPRRTPSGLVHSSKAPPPSMLRAGVLGAVLALSLVALVVIGARMAYHSGSATGQGARISPTPLAMSVSRAAGGDPAHATSVATVPSVPDLGARALASVRPPPRTVPAAIGPTPRVRPPTPPGSPVVAGGPLVASPPRVAASANPPPSSRQSTAVPEPAEAESAGAMVPVIPSSPPTEVDPLVKAVQHDIEEDRANAK